MYSSGPPFTIGIEEEYLLVDKETRSLVVDPPKSLMAECEERCGAQVTPEFLRSQIEIGTKVCNNIKEAEIELRRLRRIVIDVAGNHGMAPIAASTHPFSRWSEQKQTEKDRYNALTVEMQAAARRLLICGMHVHVGIDDDELRIDLMNQLAYFLPHLLALSCSSPFWEGERTGLMSFRLMIFNGVPRTGLPEQFSSWGEYRRHTQILVDTGIIADNSRIWWDLRPSVRYPTLETRVMDCCTTLEDALSLAALNQCLLRMLWRLRRANQRWRMYSHLLLGENRWRAMRYSHDAGLLDLGQQRIVPYSELLEELIALVREDAEALGCVAEIDRLREILARGTSAHRQLAVYDEAIRGGAAEAEALRAVVDWLVEETART
jgi:carboxylate-amine ligase